jgi:threonine/homoserine/homoserine lactone efflux protein
MGGEGWVWFTSACAFAFSMSATPGPNNAMVTASGASWGLWRTLPHMLGVSVGFPLMLLAVAFGAGEVIRSHPWMQDLLRWAGAAYLVWLAWRIATAEPSAGEGQAGGRPFSFFEAALFQWVNPKAWIIALSAVATYTTAPREAAVLAAIFLAVTLPVLAGWTLVGVGAARLLRSPAGLRAFNWAMAALLLLSLVPVLLEP